MPAKTGAVGAWRRELRSGAHGGGRERPAAGFRGGDQLGSECGQTGGRVPGRPSARARREGATTGRPGPAHGEAAQSRVLSGPVGGALSDGRGRLQATGTTAGSGRWQGVAAARDGCVGLPSAECPFTRVDRAGGVFLEHRAISSTVPGNGVQAVDRLPRGTETVDWPCGPLPRGEQQGWAAPAPGQHPASSAGRPLP